MKEFFKDNNGKYSMGRLMVFMSGLTGIGTVVSGIVLKDGYVLATGAGLLLNGVLGKGLQAYGGK